MACCGTELSPQEEPIHGIGGAFGQEHPVAVGKGEEAHLGERRVGQGLDVVEGQSQARSCRPLRHLLGPDAPGKGLSPSEARGVMLPNGACVSLLSASPLSSSPDAGPPESRWRADWRRPDLSFFALRV